MAMGNKIRTFIAIHLPDTVLRAMGRTQEAFQVHHFDIRWVRPQGMHLTLKFLGDIEEKDIENVGAAMQRACEDIQPFTLRGEGIGVFPNMKRPRVVWAGVTGDVAVLLDLQKRLEDALSDSGFPREKRRFKGHLTLGRVKGRLDTRRFGPVLDELKAFTTELFVVDSLVLYQSTLRPQGALYDRLVAVPLKGNA
jgi:2'-5' RNA ligase